jgi:hypothetical protein
LSFKLVLAVTRLGSPTKLRFEDIDKGSEQLEVGVLVEANYRGRGKYFSGKISRVRLNGTYDIAYDDGESEQSVPKDLIRVKPRYLPRAVCFDALFSTIYLYRGGSPSRLRLDDDIVNSSSASLDVGTAVEADYRGKGKYYTGKIARVRAGGTYDIDYDDGEKELMVPKDLIRVKSRLASFCES